MPRFSLSAAKTPCVHPVDLFDDDSIALFRFWDLDLSYALDCIGEHLCVLLPKLLELRSIKIGDRGLKFFHG